MKEKEIEKLFYQLIPCSLSLYLHSSQRCLLFRGTQIQCKKREKGGNESSTKWPFDELLLLLTLLPMPPLYF